MSVYKAIKGKWNKKLSEWRCEFCEKKPKAVYVVTGHDHTDSSFWVCNCGKGTSIETEWNKNPYAREACPSKYKD